MRKATNHLRKADRTLGSIIDAVGPCRISYIEPDFGSLARSIVFQQLSGSVARVIFGRLLQACNQSIDPSAILALTDEQLRAAGLSRQKSAYIRDLAGRASEIGFPGLSRLPDEKVIERLTQVKGVGTWTAQMFLMFGLRRPDVLPTSDLGIRMAIKKAYGFEDLPSKSEIEGVAEPWRPWCSVASWYLWRSLEIKPQEQADS